jgi:hypothetical protein
MSIDPAALPVVVVEPSFGGTGCGCATRVAERGVGSLVAGPGPETVAARPSLRGLAPGSVAGTVRPDNIPEVGRVTVDPLRSF